MPKPKKSLEPNKINLKESFASLKFVPRFFKEIRKVNPLLFFAILLAGILSAVIPLALLWVGKIIIDEVVVQIDAEVKNFSRLWIFVVTELGLAVLSDLLSRAVSLTDALLGDQYSINTSVKIIEKTAELNLDQLEDSEFYDKLERARRQTTGRVGLMSNILTQGEDVIVII